MRKLLAPLYLLLLVPPRTQPELAFAVSAGTTLERTLESRSVLELASFAMTLDGEDVPPEALGELALHIERDELVVVRDEYEAMAAGRPQRLRRTFAEVGGSERTRATTEGTPDDQDRTLVSALEGQAVVFAWDEAEGRFEAAFAGEGGAEPALLAELHEDMDLRRFLPPGPVSEGDSWTIDAQVFESLLEPGGNLALVEAGAEGGPPTSDRRVRDNMQGTLRASFRGVALEEGVRCARIELTLDVCTHTEDPLPAESLPEGASGTSTNALHFQWSGTLLWDLEHGHARSLDLGGDHEVTVAHEVRGELDGAPFVQTQTLKLKGDYRFTVRVARR